jgi:S1-C subfamily serine protease
MPAGGVGYRAMPPRDDRPLPESPRGEPLWLAAGAAVFGVLLGGAAVFLGMQEAPAPAPVTEAAPLAHLPELPMQVPAVESCEGSCPRGLSLVDAVAATRDMVVTLRSKETIGAGVVVDETGLVLTNFHVIAGEIRDPSHRVLSASGTPEITGAVRARFADGRELPAVLLIADRDQDIALLQLRPADSAERFKAARLGRSSGLQVGEGVFSVGTPLGLDHSVSQGIVAALGRTHILRNKQTPLIQLDASINVGNSGGPLFNLRGDLVGITTATIERAQGIAFAIPVDHIFALMRALKQGELARSGQIGVEVDSRIAVSEAAVALGYRNGLVLQQVFPGSRRRRRVCRRRHHRRGPRAALRRLRGRRGGAGPARARIRADGPRPDPRRDAGADGAARRDAAARDAGGRGGARRTARCSSTRRSCSGLHLDEKNEQPTVGELRALAPITHWRGREQLLRARITQIAGVRVHGMNELRTVLAELRQLGREGTVAITFALKDGRELPIADFPVSPP